MAYGTVNADTLVTSTSGGVLGAKNASTLQNRLIDAGFTINQRGYVSGTALSTGVYAHDRFKAGASGCTYTFTQGSAGVPIVITITAGSLQQVIEGCNMPEGGTYVLSWTGTAQARFNGGTYGSSPLSVTGITAGANTTIEFNTGTVSFPQLEVGSSATGFEYRQYQQELALCQRYCPSYSWVTGGGTNQLIGPASWTASSTGLTIHVTHPVTTRVPPTGLSFSGTTPYSFTNNNAYALSGINFNAASTAFTTLSATSTGGALNAAGFWAIQGGSFYLTGCEL